MQKIIHCIALDDEAGRRADWYNFEDERARVLSDPENDPNVTRVPFQIKVPVGTSAREITNLADEAAWDKRYLAPDGTPVIPEMGPGDRATPGAGITQPGRPRRVTVEQLTDQIANDIAYLRTVIEGPVSLPFAGQVSVLVMPDNGDDRVVVESAVSGTTTVNYTSEGLILDVHAAGELDQEPVYTASIENDDLCAENSEEPVISGPKL
jgi:hypothetical protein